MNLHEFAAPPVLELTDVTYLRERNEIIRGVSFTVRAGERWAMLGPNGAGKSTLLGFCGAVTHPTSGTVRVLGQQLVCEPRLILLDEPSTGLDIAAREQLLESIDLLTETHPEVASVPVTHHLEGTSLRRPPPTRCRSAPRRRVDVAAGAAAVTRLTSEHVSAAFSHPIDVRFDDGRWRARAATRHRAGA